MGITFLKSILTGRRHKKKNSPGQNRVEMETRSFRDDQVNEQAFDTINRGACEVRLDHIVGSVGRYHDFDGKFRIKSHVPSDRLQKIKEREYPEMKRGITAFVLITVKAKSEYRIMDKLYLLKEVQEIHSVHGEVDILAKVVLTRDLLTSDAEIIGDFVHENIRGISGVSSTRTLIPGYSKIKE